MKTRLRAIIFGATITLAGASSTFGQQQFGVDAGIPDAGNCNASVGCPLIDLAASAGAHWIRILAVWHFLEPTQNNYDWGVVPWQVWYANQKGLNVYFTATWAPQWANGATSVCPPYVDAHQFDPHGVTDPSCANGYQDVGRTVTDSSYTQSFFYNLALQFNGSTVAGCPTSTVSTCHPLVQYFGVWNEPNGLNNFNDVYYNPSNLGAYGADFASQYLIPAHNGVKQANPSASIVALDLSTGASSCGGFSNCGDWKSSWMTPFNMYYSSLYDVISIHGYNGHTVDHENVDWVNTNASSGKQIWETEAAAKDTGTSDLTDLYVDQSNRSSYWPRIFYSLGPRDCSGNPNTLVCGSGSTLSPTSYYYAYQAVYAPH